MNVSLLISVATFATMALVVVGIFAYTSQAAGRRKLLTRMETGVDTIVETNGRAQGGNWPLQGKLVAIAVKLGNYVKPKREEELARINKTFTQAGYRNKNMALIFFGAKVLCAGVLSMAFLSLQIFITRHMTVTGLMFASLALVAVGFYLPNLWLRLKVSRRAEQLSHGLPDALDLLVICVEAGMGLDAAINRVGEEMKLSNKAISEEFRLLNLELRAGKSRRDALRNLSLRTGLDDVNSLVTLLVQTEKFGTNVGQALRVHSDSMRTKRAQRVEELAAKLPLKLLFPTILFIFPALFVVILGPALTRAYRVYMGMGL
jgi:tight adherence protein C